MEITKTQADKFYASKEWSDTRKAIINNSERRCNFCGIHFAENKNDRLVVDHIKPLRSFWELRLDKNNLQLLCNDCNLLKGNKRIDDALVESIIARKGYSYSKELIKQLQNGLKINPRVTLHQALHILDSSDMQDDYHRLILELFIDSILVMFAQKYKSNKDISSIRDEIISSFYNKKDTSNIYDIKIASYEADISYLKKQIASLNTLLKQSTDKISVYEEDIMSIRDDMQVIRKAIINNHINDESPRDL